MTNRICQETISFLFYINLTMERMTISNLLLPLIFAVFLDVRLGSLVVLAGTVAIVFWV